ncbi:hypothetical protein BDV25DRAFT_166489 [Aspergillus avenaceus]|uniref:Uncharacterized protein n=1 Tax=Aspergillus avenaceus TaxID=36643 RepID=A0A5N6TE74_ASPAV|nr:hypothetical protein BDV25DRAFT_166489 [Aspergillus avenaceus]
MHVFLTAPTTLCEILEYAMSLIMLVMFLAYMYIYLEMFYQRLLEVMGWEYGQ